MRSIINPAVAALALALAMAGCSGSQVSPTPPERSLTKNEGALVAADNSFGLKLFKELNRDSRDSNIFISPLSVSMALGMTLNGARGETQSAMRQTLEVAGLTEDEINNAYRTLIDLLRGLDPRVQFEIANSIWYRNDLNVLPAFLDVNRRYFDAEVTAMDFGDPASVGTINAWVSSKTHGRIEKIIDAIPGYMVMYLIDAIYFKAPWTIEFSKDSTRRMDFTHPSGQIEQVSMMYRSGKFRHYAGSALQAVELPYGNGRYSMIVMMPNADTDADALLANMTQQSWASILAGLDSADGEIFLPRLKVEWSRRLDDALKALGMDIAFTDRANFSGIDPQGGLAITEVRHKTFVEINEEGTEAAAVTSVGVGRTAFPERFTMRMDRPYLFAIIEKANGTMMFLGKIVDP